MSIFEDNISYRPFKYPWAVREAIKHSIDMAWHEKQMELQDDIRQWNTKDGLTTVNTKHEVNKHIISRILNLFVEMDKKVGHGYTTILPYVHNNEIRNLLLTFASREIIHQRAYALLSETLGTSDSGWCEFRQYKEMQDKLDAMTVENVDLNNPLNFAKALTKIYLSEGIGLFASFAILLNFKRFGLLVGFSDAASWSLNDENHHVECNINIVQTVASECLNELEGLELKRYTKDVADKLKQAEKQFLDIVFDMGDAEDMTKEQCCGYIDYMHDLRLYQAGYKDFEEVSKNTLPWMDWMLDGEKHGSFFEKKISDYAHTGLVGKIDYSRYRNI